VGATFPIHGLASCLWSVKDNVVSMIHLIHVRLTPGQWQMSTSVTAREPGPPPIRTAMHVGWRAPLFGNRAHRGPSSELGVGRGIWGGQSFFLPMEQEWGQRKHAERERALRMLKLLVPVPAGQLALALPQLHCSIPPWDLGASKFHVWTKLKFNTAPHQES
jgi:hypothetical protein